MHPLIEVLYYAADELQRREEQEAGRKDISKGTAQEALRFSNTYYEVKGLLGNGIDADLQGADEVLKTLNDDASNKHAILLPEEIMIYEHFAVLLETVLRLSKEGELSNG